MGLHGRENCFLEVVGEDEGGRGGGGLPASEEGRMVVERVVDELELEVNVCIVSYALWIWFGSCWLGWRAWLMGWEVFRIGEVVPVYSLKGGGCRVEEAMGYRGELAEGEGEEKYEESRDRDAEEEAAAENEIEAAKRTKHEDITG
jgi:hypothetical protein